MKFHTDENVAEVVALGMRRRGFDVTTTSQVGLRGAKDEEQLAFSLG
jgi:predicted nuclease of predicted toxin-antitoxin system